MEPLISVVIITYNQEKYIAETIESVLAQKTEYDFEILIGDDCSIDSTRDVISRYLDLLPGRIKLITDKKNVGLLKNFNRTVKEARGKYVAGVAGDDFWNDSEKLQIQGKFLEENDDYGMVFSDAYMLNEATGIVEEYTQQSREHSLVNPSFIEQTLVLNKVIAGTVMFRKSLFDKYYDVEELDRLGIFIEDAPLWLEIAARSKAQFMPEKLLTYRSITDSVSRPSSIERQILFHENCYKCMLHYFHKFRDRLNQPELVLELIHWHYNSWILNLAHKNCDSALVKESFKNIKNMSGNSYISIRDRIRLFASYIPFGQELYTSLKSLKNMAK